MFDKEIQEIQLEKVTWDVYSTDDRTISRLAMLYRNQEQILKAIKMLNENIVGPARNKEEDEMYTARMVHEAETRHIEEMVERCKKMGENN